MLELFRAAGDLEVFGEILHAVHVLVEEALCALVRFRDGEPFADDLLVEEVEVGHLARVRSVRHLDDGVDVHVGYHRAPRLAADLGVVDDPLGRHDEAPRRAGELVVHNEDAVDLAVAVLVAARHVHEDDVRIGGGDERHRLSGEGIDHRLRGRVLQRVGAEEVARGNERHSHHPREEAPLIARVRRLGDDLDRARFDGAAPGRREAAELMAERIGGLDLRYTPCADEGVEIVHGGLPGDREIAPLLPDDLVNDRHRDADMAEASRGDVRAVRNEPLDGFLHCYPLVDEGRRLVRGDPGALLVGIVEAEKLALSFFENVHQVPPGHEPARRSSLSFAIIRNSRDCGRSRCAGSRSFPPRSRGASGRGRNARPGTRA